MTAKELAIQIKRKAALWWAEHAPIGDMSQHAFCEAVTSVTSDDVIDGLMSRMIDLCADADRYRFIRDHLAVWEVGIGNAPPMWSFHHIPGRHATFDAAVDAAIAESAKWGDG